MNQNFGRVLFNLIQSFSSKSKKFITKYPKISLYQIVETREHLFFLITLFCSHQPCLISVRSKKVPVGTNQIQRHALSFKNFKVTQEPRDKRSQSVDSREEHNSFKVCMTPRIWSPRLEVDGHQFLGTPRSENIRRAMPDT